MTGLDTNVLARYYIADTGDDQAQHQREAARRLLESGQPLMVCKTVLLELEWVMRGYYRFTQPQVQSALQHLLAQAHITVEDRPVVEQALSAYQSGLDWADALHHASYRACQQMASFDDKRFARRAKRLGLMLGVVAPK